MAGEVVRFPKRPGIWRRLRANGAGPPGLPFRERCRKAVATLLWFGSAILLAAVLVGWTALLGLMWWRGLDDPIELAIGGGMAILITGGFFNYVTGLHARAVNARHMAELAQQEESRK